MVQFLAEAFHDLPDACLVGCVGIRGLPFMGGPTGPYLEGDSSSSKRKRKKREQHSTEHNNSHPCVFDIYILQFSWLAVSLLLMFAFYYPASSFQESWSASSAAIPVVCQA